MCESKALQLQAFPIQSENKSLVFKKSRIVIEISNKISLLDRKIYNFLLLAWYEFLKRNNFSMEDADNVEGLKLPLDFVYSYFNFGKKKGQRHDFEKFIGSVENLLTTKILYGIDSDDITKIKRKSFELLSSEKSGIRDGYFYFDFPKDLRIDVLFPKSFTLLDMNIINKFNTNYSLALYEFVKSYYDVKVPVLDIEVFKSLMGVEEGRYGRIFDLKKWVIEPSINEVREIANLDIQYDLLKIGRKYDRIKLIVVKNNSLTDEELLSISLSLPKKLKDNTKILDLIKSFSQGRSVRYLVSNVEYSFLNCKDLSKFYSYLKLALTEDYAGYTRQLKEELDIEKQRILDLRLERLENLKNCEEDVEAQNFLFRVLDYVSENVSGKIYKLWMDGIRLYDFHSEYKVEFLVSSKQAVKFLTENYKGLFYEAVNDNLGHFEGELKFTWFDVGE